jgi:hypothetical protein
MAPFLILVIITQNLASSALPCCKFICKDIIGIISLIARSFAASVIEDAGTDMFYRTLDKQLVRGLIPIYN